MVNSDKVELNLTADEDSYKSCFARSMAVNSLHKNKDFAVQIKDEVVQSFTRVGSLDVKNSWNFESLSGRLTKVGNKFHVLSYK